MNVAIGTIGDFFLSIWERRKEILYCSGSACTARENSPTPQCVVNGIGCYLVIYLSMYMLSLKYYRESSKILLLQIQ